MTQRTDNTDAIFDAAARWVARRDAGLPASEQAEFEHWLAADARHQTAFEHYARTWSALDAPARPGARQAVMRGLETRARRRRSRRLRATAAMACACALVVFASVAVWQWHGANDSWNPWTKSGALPSGAVVTQPERRVLEDGSVVELKPGAEIDVRYDEAARRVVLVKGEAHFQVVKGLPRPFIVVAGGMEVRAVGTAFAVQLRAEQVEVLVTEGRVSLEKRAAASAAPPEAAAETPAAAEPVPLATLGMRERAVVAVANASCEVGTAEPVTTVSAVAPSEINERLAWRIPRLEFSGTPLSEAVALINRSSQLPDGSVSAKLVLDRSLSRLASEPVSGIFRADNIEAFVQVLHLSMGIESERRDGEIILRRAGN